MGSIRTRLTLSHLAVIVLAMGFSGILLLSLLERYFLQAMEQSLISQARITAQALLPDAMMEGRGVGSGSAAWNTIQNRSSNFELQTENVAPLPAGATLEDTDLSVLTDASLRLSAQLDTRIRVLDLDGVVRVDSWQMGETGAVHAGQDAELADDSLVSQALAGQEAVRVDGSRGDELRTMHVAIPLATGEQLLGAVYLSQPLRDVSVIVRDLRARWLVATAVALCLSATVGLLLSGAITHPLRRLTAAAGSVALGKLDTQVPASSRDELGRLGHAFNDMTARLRATRQIQVDFVANVSHELRTPLTSIKGLVETLRAGAVEDLQVRDHFLESVEVETDRLIRLVSDLLVLSRADSDELDLVCQEFSLENLVQTTLERMAPQAQNGSVTLVMDSPCRGGRVSADRDRVEQVLINLLDNAIKYSRPGGKVRVSVLPLPQDEGDRGHWAQVLVQDEGVGISRSDLERVGERFYRVDRARSRAEGGSGLGLAIARAIVEAHGGRLWLESTEDSGTIAGFSLPSSPQTH